MRAEGNEPEHDHRRMAHEVEPKQADERNHQAERATSTAPRPLVERIGMAVIALVIALFFGGVAVAAFAGGEPFLGVMAMIGALMTVWVGMTTMLRG
jgi:hypothetical protein